MRWADVDLTAGRVTITRTAAWVGGKVIFTEPKTRAGRRWSRSPPKRSPSCATIWKRQAAERLAVGSVYSDQNLVFCDELGEPYRPANITRRFARDVKQAGWPPVTLHALRHTFCTLALGSRVPVKVVAELVGHSSTSITSDLYQHVTPTMAEEATSKVANLIGKGRR